MLQEKKNNIKLAELLHRFVPIGPNATFSQQIIYIVNRMNSVNSSSDIDTWFTLFHKTNFILLECTYVLSSS